MKKKTRIGYLFLAPVLMFGFGYLLVPLYTVFCNVTGLNGKTGSLSTVEAAVIKPDLERKVTVEFTSTLNQNVPWEFKPAVNSMEVYPGISYSTNYVARNKLNQAMISQAVPSVTPFRAAAYFNKTECFCFTQQKFAAKERREMPLIFVVDPDLPEDVKTVTLSYTLFDVSHLVN